jgi:hypothetical protein
MKVCESMQFCLHSERIYDVNLHGQQCYPDALQWRFCLEACVPLVDFVALKCRLSGVEFPRKIHPHFQPLHDGSPTSLSLELWHLKSVPIGH